MKIARKMEMKAEEFATKDFGLSVFLATVEPDRIKFRRLEKINDREVNFIFNSPEDCSELAVKYFSDEGYVNARAYAGKMRDFKTMLHAVATRT